MTAKTWCKLLLESERSIPKTTNSSSLKNFLVVKLNENKCGDTFFGSLRHHNRLTSTTRQQQNIVVLFCFYSGFILVNASLHLFFFVEGVLRILIQSLTNLLGDLLNMRFYPTAVLN